ncbi:MAG: DNA/RNA non-specific endonuclease [Thiothrix sp.]
MKLNTITQTIAVILIASSVVACSSPSPSNTDPSSVSGTLGGATTNTVTHGDNLTSGSEGGSCYGDYVDGVQPRLTNAKLASKTRALCFAEFSILHSGLTRTPLWASEHLTYAELLMDIDRTDNFHAEPTLPADERSELADYAGSGYDRGHLAPAGDMPTEQAMRESFSLANMTPQNPTNNRGLWSSIENKTRDLAQQRGELFVVSGAVFAGATLNSINNRVLVPSHYFKAVYDANTGESGAYWVVNDASKNYKMVSAAELAQLAGIDPFPSISDYSKTNTMALPQP